MMGFPLVALGALKRNHCLLFKATDGTAGLHRGRVKKGIKKEPKAAFAAGENTRGQEVREKQQSFSASAGRLSEAGDIRGRSWGRNEKKKGELPLGSSQRRKGQGEHRELPFWAA
ncbi:hypothetical protein ACFX19_020274 [Malus domestica]